MNSVILGKGVFKFWTTSQRIFAAGCIAFGLWAVGWFTWTALDIIFRWSSAFGVNQAETISPVAPPAQETVAVKDEGRLYVEPSFLSFGALSLPIETPPAAPVTTPAPEPPRTGHRVRRKTHKYYPAKPIPAFWIVRNN